ncbi:MAG: molybdenum cofactor guanylyltransferase [Leptolyngbyaceae cyanobacterium bins.349]|nr:molybdenum cofactor guanylyltransferase [Leptolyngbyaceae cyanobacterium bins.349]
MNSLSAIVLAGGKSSRMGRDKALISVNGEPLLHRTCRIALQCTPTVAILTDRVEAYAAIAPLECQFLQETPLEHESGDDASDREPFPHGPLVGFAQALTWVETDWVLLLACDLPCLQASILQRWMQQLPDEQAAIALLPRTQTGWEPLCGFYHQRCFSTLIPFVQSGGRSFQRWLEQVPVQAIAFSSAPEECQREHQMLFNCNTPDDLAAIPPEF